VKHVTIWSVCYKSLLDFEGVDPLPAYTLLRRVGRSLRIFFHCRRLLYVRCVVVRALLSSSASPKPMTFLAPWRSLCRSREHDLESQKKRSPLTESCFNPPCSSCYQGLCELWIYFISVCLKKRTEIYQKPNVNGVPFQIKYSTGNCSWYICRECVTTVGCRIREVTQWNENFTSPTAVSNVESGLMGGKSVCDNIPGFVCRIRHRYLSMNSRRVSWKVLSCTGLWSRSRVRLLIAEDVGTRCLEFVMTELFVFRSNLRLCSGIMLGKRNFCRFERKVRGKFCNLHGRHSVVRVRVSRSVSLYGDETFARRRNRVTAIMLARLFSAHSKRSGTLCFGDDNRIGSSVTFARRLMHGSTDGQPFLCVGWWLAPCCQVDCRRVWR
jgi:hypothetical protein